MYNSYRYRLLGSIDFDLLWASHRHTFFQFSLADITHSSRCKSAELLSFGGGARACSCIIKEDVGLRVTDSVRKDSEDISLDMVTVLLWVQQLFPNLME